MYLYLTIFFVVLVLYLRTITQPQQRGILMRVMAFLGIFVGISDMLGGYDRYIYGEVFDRLADAMRGGGNIYEAIIFSLYGNEFGYCFVNVFVGLFSANRYIFILLVTLIIYALLYVSFKRYTANYAFAVLLFLGLWFFFSFTYLRQVLGAAVAWLSIKYVIERRLKMFLLVVFLGFSFHNSAIMLLPLYFVPIRAFDRKIILMVMGVLLLLGLTGGPGAVFDAYGSVTEDKRVGMNMEDTSGFRIAYFIEALFFLFFILKNYDVITETDEQTVMTNAALIFCGILLFFVKSENGGRISWFYMIGIISTLTYIATWQQRVTNTSVALIVLSFFLYFRILTGWGVLLSPYKTIFTDGVRDGDFVYTIYEYDQRYAEDKFYR